MAANALLAIASAYQGKPVPCRPSLSPTVSRAISEFLAAKERSGRSARYLRQLRTVLERFRRGRGSQRLADIEAREIEIWLHAQGWAPRTVANSLADLRTLFAWCQKRGYVDRNPAAAVDPPRQRCAPIAIHTPEEVRAVLESARRTDLPVMRMLALRYFAGLRAAEAFRLREEDIQTDRGYIEVPAAKAKTRARRLVPIADNLRAWLALGGVLGPCRTDRVRQAIKASGVACPHNVTRHSFVSYRLALAGSAATTALEAGHSETMLFAHYREIVTKDQATKYWEIRPIEEN